MAPRRSATAAGRRVSRLEQGSEASLWAVPQSACGSAPHTCSGEDSGPIARASGVPFRAVARTGLWRARLLPSVVPQSMSSRSSSRVTLGSVGCSKLLRPWLAWRLLSTWSRCWDWCALLAGTASWRRTRLLARSPRLAGLSARPSRSRPRSSRRFAGSRGRGPEESREQRPRPRLGVPRA